MIKNVLKTIGAVCCFPIYGIGYVTGFVITLLVNSYEDGEDQVDSNW